MTVLVILSIGYRYVGSPDAAPINRIMPLVTLKLPIEKVLVFDRTRADIGFPEGFIYASLALIQYFSGTNLLPLRVA